MSVDEELVLLTDRLTAIRSSIQQLQDAEAAMVAAITAKITEGPVRDDTGKVIAVVKPPGLRFNTKRALKELHEDILDTYVDFSPKKLKDAEPDLYDSFRDSSGTAKVIISDDDD